MIASSRFQLTSNVAFQILSQVVDGRDEAGLAVGIPFKLTCPDECRAEAASLVADVIAVFLFLCRNCHFNIFEKADDGDSLSFS